MGFIYFVEGIIDITLWSVCNIGHEFNDLPTYIGQIDAYWYHFVVLGLN